MKDNTYTTYKDNKWEELDNACKNYLKKCIAEESAPNKTGLAIFININAHTIHNWKQNAKGEKKNLWKVINKYHNVIKDFWIKGLYKDTAGRIFYLKTGFHMKEVGVNDNKIKIELSNNSGHSVEIKK